MGYRESLSAGENHTPPLQTIGPRQRYQQSKGCCTAVPGADEAARGKASDADHRREIFAANLARVPTLMTTPAIPVRPSLQAGLMIQRFPAPGAIRQTDDVSEQLLEEPGSTGEEDSFGEGSPGPLLVEDSAESLEPGQMRRSDFLDRLEAEVCRAADQELAGTGRSTDGCPYLERWLGYYRQQDSRHLERAVRRFAPETRQATTAREYLPLVAARIRRSVSVWARTGQLTGLPHGIAASLPTFGLLNAFGGMLGGLFFKAREGGIRSPVGPQTVRHQLGPGRPLDHSLSSRMGAVFGTDLSTVRVHTDTTGTRLAHDLNARAFTVGRHMAFAAGEYRPGTLIGDALVAHELAHVVQQRGADPTGLSAGTTQPGHAALEEEADLSATSAVVSLWSRAIGGLLHAGATSLPRLRSGLRLQRCAAAATRQQVLPRINQVASQACTAQQRQSMEQANPCCTENMLDQFHRARVAAIPIVRRAAQRLSSSPAEVAGPLMAHFRVSPNDTQRIAVIVRQINLMATTLESRVSNFTVSCRDYSDPMCHGFSTPARIVPNCPGSASFDIAFCGNYDGAARAAPGEWAPFLFRQEWLSTVIHEYVHASCPGAAAILPSGSEIYDHQAGYPPEPDVAINNPTSYEKFILATGH